MSNIIVSPASGVIEFNTGDPSGSAFYTSTAPIRLDATGGNSWITGSSVGIGTTNPLAMLDVRGDISGSGNFLGTGIGNRITTNGTPYLLSGDSPAETQTLQDVTTNGNTTTTSILSTGPHISGVTGLFSHNVSVGVAPSTYAFETNRGSAIKLSSTTASISIGSSWGDGVLNLKNGVTVFTSFDIPNGKIVNNLGKYLTAAGTAAQFGTQDGLDTTFVVGGVEKMRIDTDGNVGIGTDNPNTLLDVRGTISGYTGLFDDKVGIGTNSPQAALDVARDTDVSGIIGRAQIGYAGDSDVASFAHVDFANATDFALAQTSAGHTVINARDGYNIYFREGDANMAAFDGSTKDFYVDTNTLYVDASEDRVGINESSPSYTLDVTAEDASSLLSRFYNSSSTNGQGLLVRAGETSNADRIFQCSSRTDTKVMTVNSNGSVGVGTTTPAGRFDIVSSRNIESDLSDADNYHLHLHNNSDDTDESIGIGFGITSDADALGACIGHERKGASSFGDLFFATKPDGGSVTERVRIASDGNVGIGTNAPSSKLDVRGTISGLSGLFGGTIKTEVYAIGSLPSASPAGQRAFVNDSYYAYNYSVIGNTAYAGGSYPAPVYSDGTYWKYG